MLPWHLLFKRKLKKCRIQPTGVITGFEKGILWLFMNFFPIIFRTPYWFGKHVHFLLFMIVLIIKFYSTTFYTFLSWYVNISFCMALHLVYIHLDYKTNVSERFACGFMYYRPVHEQLRSFQCHVLLSFSDTVKVCKLLCSRLNRNLELFIPDIKSK